MLLTRFGLQIPSFTYPGVPDSQLFERVATIARTAEESGFDSVWVMDHFYQLAMIGPPTEPMLEAYTLLAGLAARTSRVRLGTLVTGVTYRNPALLAKTVTTLDVVSSGRAVLGLGAAWNEDEHAGYGFAFPPAGERLERLEEALQICRAMFTEDAPSVSGRHYSISGALNHPRPIRRSIPILVGGNGERRTLRLVAEYADACNLFGDPETIRHKLAVLERHCEAVGRDPAQITKTALKTMLIRESAEEAQRAGAQAAITRHLPPEQFRAIAMVGGPDRICEEVGAHLDAGLDGMIFNFSDAGDPDAVALAGETLTKAFGPG
jgi:F420-dependent oxidoreductase-like protein